MDPSTNDLYSALLTATENAILLAHTYDSQAGTSLAAGFPTLPETPPDGTGAAPTGPAYLPNGATTPDADSMVVIKAIEDFRAANKSSQFAQVRNLCTNLPDRWFIQDTLDTINNPNDPGFFQCQANTNAARTYLTMRGGAGRRDYYVPVYKATKSNTGLFTQGALIPDGGAFAGDFVIGGIVVWKGVRLVDVPSILNILLQQAFKNPTVNNQ